MNGATFRDVAVIAAKKYLCFLDRKAAASGTHATETASQVFAVSRLPKSETDFFCELVQSLRQADDYEVQINKIPTDNISVIKFGTKSGVPYAILRVARSDKPVPQEISPEQFSKLAPSSITLNSDMRFLYRRLRDFYLDNALNFSPPPPSAPPAHTFPLQVSPSAEQLAAIEGALTHPVSYIWGPPGTGKTKVVLSDCLLRYIQAKKRVFLLAPTNNAVEQMLRGVLPILRDAGVDLHCAYRIGMASAQFAREFPEVVGSSELEAEQAELTARQTELKKELLSARKRERELSEVKARQHALDVVQNKLEDFFRLEAEQTTVQKTREQISASLAEAKAYQRSRSAALEQQEVSVRAYDDLIRYYQKQLKYPPLFFWLRKRRDAALSELRTLPQKSVEARRQLEQNASELRAAETAVQERERALRAAELQEQELKNRRNAILEDCMDVDGIPPDLWARFHDILNGEDLPLKEILDEMQHQTEEEHQALLQTPCRESDAIAEELSEVEKTLTANVEDGKLKQRKEALVLAATVYSALKWLPVPDGAPVSHVFLDEAGYTSVMLGAVAFACDCPVTYLGDHMQLAPFCEMNRIAPEDEEVSLFALPCICFSEIFSQPFSDISRSFQKSQKKATPFPTPNFHLLPRFLLTVSYRFGDALAKILSDYIYPFRFTGAATSDFSVTVLSAPYLAGRETRQNLGEADVITSYLSGNNLADYAVLTPYKNQVHLLRNRLKLRADTVLTVHRAQGMEFDTVILSVSDAYSQKPYFTDSCLPAGKSCLNTAISRAKKRLILVCDTSYWQRQPEQLISELLAISKDLNASPDHLGEEG